jgi:hypothetical protein
MANFLITTANTLQEGTSTADTFYFNTARGVSIRGADGNDVLTAGTANLTATNALIAGNAGNDTINLLSSFNTNQGSIFGGAGNDTISASEFSAVDTTLQGGGGNDSITLASADVVRGNIGLNGGDDTLTISAGGLNAASAIVALGGGADTLTAVQINNVGSTINGGGGADTINIDAGSMAGGQVNGDVLADNEFFGNDTISLNLTTIAGGATINGGYGNDTISAFADITTAFVNGNVGADVITINGIASGAAANSAFVGGGAGNDTMSVGQNTGALSFGTVMGGGGADTITYSADIGLVLGNSAGTTGGFIQGGLGSDSISFNGTETAGNATLLYGSAAESNVDGIDVVSSNTNHTGARTDVLVFNVLRVNTATSLEDDNGGVTNGGANEVYTGVGGIVTFTSTFSDNISDQVSALDANTENGAVALFSKGAGAAGDSTRYLFMQGGSAGTADDLVVKVNENSTTGSFAAVSILGGSAIALDLV